MMGGLLVVLMLGLLAAAPAAANVNPFEIREYQADLGVSYEEAKAHLEIQQRGASIVSELKKTLGDHYAGVWFDNKAGEFVVPLLPSASREVVISVLARDELQNDFRTASARFSWQELNAAQEQLNDSLRGEVEDGLVATSLDPGANAVVVHQSEDASKAVQAKVRVEVAETGEAQIRTEEDARLGFDSMGCAWENENASCDPPFRAGVRMIAPEAGCTGAFKAYSSTGDRYVLTAGHCGPAGTSWKAKNTFEWNKFYDLGTTEQAKHDSQGDWSKINVTGSGYWDVTPWPASVVIWAKWDPFNHGSNLNPPPANSDYPIYGTGSSYKGMHVCHSGITTGGSCGFVTALDKSVEATEGGWVHHLTEFGPACGGPGDSGGPAFAGNLAYGIYVGADSEYEVCKRPSYYYEIGKVTADLDVEVAQGTESPPLPPYSYDEEDHSPGPRAIVDRYNIVHTFHRTPSGGLGHNWHVPWESGWGSETLTGSVASHPHAVVDKDGGINVFYRTPSGGLGHNWWEVGGTSWGYETLAGSLASEPRAIVDKDKIVHVFYRTPSGGLGHNWHVPWESGWGSETMTGSLASDPRPVVDKDGGINIFYRTPSGGLGHNWWEVGGSSWGYETLAGSLASEPRAIVEPNKTVHVFYRTPSGGLGHNWHVPWESGWGSEVMTGSVASEPHAVVDEDGGINIFYRTPSGGLGHNWWEVGGSSWGYETLAGSLASEPHPIVEPNKTVHVFYRTPSGGLGHNWHVPWESGWGSETLAGSLASEPHPIVDKDGGINVFYRTPSGGLGHNWWEVGGSIWGSETLAGSIAPSPPVTATGSASAITSNGAKVEGTVNPEGSPTSYYFEYGTTTSYGSKQPVSGQGIGNGYANLSVSETLSGLSPSTLYHYRLVAVSPEGTTNGADKTLTTISVTASQLASMSVTEPFNGSSGSLANFGSKWSALGWAAGTTPKGTNTTTGWGPSSSFSTLNGAYYNSSFTDSGSGIAAVATMAANPISTERYFSVSTDMPTPASTRAGYELRFINTATNTYEVKLLKWVGGSQTVLASKSGYTFQNGHSFAIVDQGSTVSAWTNTGSGFSQLLSATDSAFSSGNAGVAAAGSATRLTNFKAGSL